MYHNLYGTSGLYLGVDGAISCASCFNVEVAEAATGDMCTLSMYVY